MKNMTSKAQERKALEEIKAILLQLEPDGYVRTAFEGCFEIAESNIDNDFADSMKQRAESAEKKAQEFSRLADERKNEIERMDGINEELRRDITGTEQVLEAERKTNGETISHLNGALDECRRDAEGMEQHIKDLENEIIRLKAKIYDLAFTK